MQTERANWGRTAVVVAVLGALVVAPWLVAKADHDNWGLHDLTRRLPWHNPAVGLAGDLTTDEAAAQACRSVPTFEVLADDGGAVLSFPGSLTLEQANARLEDLDVPLELGVWPQAGARPLSMSSGGFGGGDPALYFAMEGATTWTGLLLTPVLLPRGSAAVGLTIACVDAAEPSSSGRPHPFGPGGELACRGIPGMSTAAAHAWLAERYERVTLLRHRGPRYEEVEAVPDEAVLAWVDAVDEAAWLGFVLPGDPGAELGWRIPELGGCD